MQIFSPSDLTVILFGILIAFLWLTLNTIQTHKLQNLLTKEKEKYRLLEKENLNLRNRIYFLSGSKK